MDNKYSTYSNPLTERYCSKDMSYIFSPQFKFSTWRKLWITLAKGEKSLGLNITDEQIKELESFKDDINFEVALEREKIVKHDVMSHVYAYGVQCPNAKGIIHLGATSCFVGDNTELIVMKEALLVVKKKIINVLKKADFYKDIQNLEKGLDTVIGERGLGLSGGQKQRISLARALYGNPEILILDDSFSAIDANTESKIVNSLKENRKDKTNIIISHRISAVEHSDLILVLDNGKIIDRGTHEELISRDSWYKEQFEYQSLDKEEENEA